MQNVKWGVLGTANIAKGCTIPGLQQAKSCELFAIAGRNLEKAESFKKEFGFEKAYGSYQELLEDKDVQAVYIPLPNHLHGQWIKAALEYGKHVLCEKPMALNAKEAKELFTLAEDKGLFLMEAYAYLHTEYMASLRKDLSEGVIGKVDYIESEFLTQGYTEDIRLYKEQGGGAMYDLGCYCTTMFLSLIDSEPEAVRANAFFTDKGVDELTTAIIKFKNGVRASLTVGMILGKDSNDRNDSLYIHGSKGCIRSDVEYNQSGDLSYRIYTDGQVIERKLSVPPNYSLEVEQLSRCILGEEKPFVTADFSVRNAELMDMIFAELENK